MKYFKFSLSFVLLMAICFLLNTPFGKLPPLAKFLSPATGFWQNAESVTAFKDQTLHLKGLQAPVSIVYDEHLIPHIYAANEHDLYVAQGYVTAQFRLWQMEIQTRAASGRLSEILGPSTLELDRYERRTGMVFGAAKIYEVMKKDPLVSDLLEAYASGVNEYIAQLDAASLPFEYKLLNYTPAKWTPLETGLLLKKMAENLTAMEHDIEHSNALDQYGADAFNLIYKSYWSEQDPIIPKGTIFTKSSEGNQDSKKVLANNFDLQFPFESLAQQAETNAWQGDQEADYLLGSNNWAVSGSKTKSGKPILCNDPHLKLSLPSIWFQVHLSCPAYNVCGASLPGAPGVISGFNDSIAWGVTNAGRDVRDWYQIKFRDAAANEYLLDGAWVPVKKVVEKIDIKGASTMYDTVRYTIFGPVVYDQHFSQHNRTDLALRWTAHDESEEMITFNRLNKAKNIADYFEAISHFACPAQNFVYASKQGDIAIQQQGKFPIEQKDQAIFVQDGTHKSNALNTYIPFQDNPHMVNPSRGFVSSANQHPTDTTYPYPYAGVFEYFRNRRINGFLAALQSAQMVDMERLQQDNFNLLAKEMLPTLLTKLKDLKLSEAEMNVKQSLMSWNFKNDANEVAPIYFEIWKDTFKHLLWDELYKNKEEMRIPDDITTIHFVLDPIQSKFYDELGTSKVETLEDLVAESFLAACSKIEQVHTKNWSDYKATSISYLIPNMPAFSAMNVPCGGNKQIVNAISKYNGPSWRMIVELTDDIRAEAIYPAGQSGNPGSKFYDNMIADWAAGKYYEVYHSADINKMKMHALYQVQLNP